MLCIFDLDGTLINSLEDLAAAADHALAQLDAPGHTVEEYRFLVGNGARRLMEQALPASRRDEETVSRALALFSAYYNDHCDIRTRPYDGVEAMLQTLQQAGIKLAVLSNKPDVFARRITQQMFPQGGFAAVCGQREDVARKPAPDGVFALMAQTGERAEDTYMIGDSDVDILTANAAGVHGIGCLWGFRDRAELEDAGAEEIAASIDGLIHILLTKKS